MLSHLISISLTFFAYLLTIVNHLFVFQLAVRPGLYALSWLDITVSFVVRPQILTINSELKYFIKDSDPFRTTG